MKFLNALFLVFFSLIILSCESGDNSFSPVDNSENTIPTSSKTDVISTQDGFEISKLIDGSKGGSITFDTIYADNSGKTLEINLSLTFDKNSFTGNKTITIIPNLVDASVQLYPEMIFSKPAKLNLSYSGIDLLLLGFDANSIVDFVYQPDDGNAQYILNNECKVKWNTQTLYVTNAKLPHFSRYCFIRKSL
jgi:hypothetical protein